MQSLQKGFIIRFFVVILGMVALALLAVRTFALPPNTFPVGGIFTIKEGDSLGAVAYRLSQEHIIASPEAFKLLMLALGKEKRIAVGEYAFEAPLTLPEVALKLSGSDFGIIQNRVTFPEGYTNRQVAERLTATFPTFDTAQFLELAKDRQGYLFPDTYSFSPQVTPQAVVAELTETFVTRTAALSFADSSRSRQDIIIMASILEREAGTAEEMSIIAGILWKRIDRGMALQVDAPFFFLFGKTSSELTAADLAADSPYNTYRYTGLPPAPIGNPGLAAIEAALHPAESSYLYYLHDASGGVHYGATYEEHLANKKKYLQ
ncbi:endolytic transglycosylase MltG [Candidatus Nomurabacteria bacterium]|nr:endolytic transglycosylase MltG [Candidatus Nomurabacteria bacterium]